MGKSTISMAIFNSYVKLPEGTCTSFWNLANHNGSGPKGTRGDIEKNGCRDHSPVAVS